MDFTFHLRPFSSYLFSRLDIGRNFSQIMFFPNYLREAEVSRHWQLKLCFTVYRNEKSTRFLWHLLFSCLILAKKIIHFIFEQKLSKKILDIFVDGTKKNCVGNIVF